MSYNHVPHRPGSKTCLCILLFVLLSAASWPSTRAFGLFNGHHFDYRNANSNKGNTKFKDNRQFYARNWEPSPFWWRERRSSSQSYSPAVDNPTHHDLFREVAPLPQLITAKVPVEFPSQFEKFNVFSPVVQGQLIKDQRNNEVLHSKSQQPPTIDSETFSTIQHNTPLKELKLIYKMKKVNQIKDALRRKAKLEASAEKDRLLLVNLKSLAEQERLKDEARQESSKNQHKTLKSRRAKLLASRAHLTNISPEAQKGPDQTFGGRMTNGKESLSFDVPLSHHHADDVEDLPRVEWFGKPASRYPVAPASHSLGSFSQTPSSGGFQYHHGGTANSNARMESLVHHGESTQPKVMYSDFAFLPFSDDSFDSGTSSHAASQALQPGNTRLGGRPVKQQDDIAGFWEEGNFQQSSKDCETIATKTCVTDLECSCHGFYFCRTDQGKCDIKISEKPATSQDVWHEAPVDFGFLTKRQSGLDASMEDSQIRDADGSQIQTSGKGSEALEING